MNVLRVRDYLDEKFGEFILGPAKTGSRGTYLVYGEVQPGKAHRVAPGEGHEEVLMVVSGRGWLVTRAGERAIIAEEALYLGPDFKGTLHAEGAETLRFVSAGGHVPGGHRH